MYGCVDFVLSLLLLTALLTFVRLNNKLKLYIDGRLFE